MVIANEQTSYTPCQPAFNNMYKKYIYIFIPAAATYRKEERRDRLKKNPKTTKGIKHEDSSFDAHSFSKENFFIILVGNALFIL